MSESNEKSHLNLKMAPSTAISLLLSTISLTRQVNLDLREKKKEKERERERYGRGERERLKVTFE